MVGMSKHKRQARKAVSMYSILGSLALLFVIALLIANAAEPYLSSGAVWCRHSIQLLEGSTSLAARALPFLRSEVSKIMSESVVTLHRGQQAAALAAVFGAQTLPCVVYIPPYCADRTIAQCRPQTLQWPQGNANTALDVSKVSTWLHTVAHAQLRLVSDIHSESQFVETLSGGMPGATVAVGALTSSWVETQLGAEWAASVNATSAARHKVKGDGAFVVRSPSDCNFFEDMKCNVTVEATPKIIKARKEMEDYRVKILLSQPPTVQNYTEVGFTVVRTPPLLLEALQSYLHLHRNKYSREDEVDEVINLLVDLPETGPMRKSVFDIMQPAMEKWSGIPLKPQAVYGIRVYRRRATLDLHIDRVDTHIISAIINVAQQVEKPWPLEILDHYGHNHKVTIVPGEMILYEGASCAHGREERLAGDWFANVFVHMSPAQPSS